MTAEGKGLPRGQNNVNTLSPKSDQGLNTPHSNITWRNIQGKRMTEMFTKHEMPWRLTQLSQQGTFDKRKALIEYACWYQGLRGNLNKDKHIISP